MSIGDHCSLPLKSAPLAMGADRLGRSNHVNMIEKQQIILGYFKQGKSKKLLARELGISPHTVGHL